MRCSAYCTAGVYHLNAIAEHFKATHYVKFYRTVLYIFNNQTNAEIFFFNSGCFVSWGLKRRGEQQLLTLINQFARDPLPTFEKDYFAYCYGEDTTIAPHDRFNIDIITLESEDVSIKLAIAYGIAQSLKLQVYEESVLQTILKNSKLPEELARHGRIPLSGPAISKRMGEIFLERTVVNLNSEYLDMPEYFWRYPRLEAYYTRTEKFLDIKSRVNSLNQRLKVLHELFDMLTTQLQHRHSTILEVIIILLILIEVIVSLRNLLF